MKTIHTLVDSTTKPTKRCFLTSFSPSLTHYTTMSFNFDDDPSDDDDIDLDAFDDTGLLALSYRQEDPAAVAAAAASMPVSELNAEDDESEVDWEDADQDDSHDASCNEQSNAEDDLDRKLSALPTHGVTVTFSSTTNTPDELGESIELDGTTPKLSEQTKKRKRTTVRVLKDVPYHTQQLILGVRRSHLLCSLAHSMQCSSISSAASTSQMSPDPRIGKEEEESRALLFNMAYSLVPPRFHSTDSEVQAIDAYARKYNMPTNQQLHDFSQWFFQLVNAGARRRETIRQNHAEGAARQSCVSTKRSRKSSARSKRRNSNGKAERNDYEPDINPSYSQGIPSTHDLIKKLEYLSPFYDTDPQLFINDGVDVIGLVENINPLEKVLLFIAMSRLVTYVLSLSLETSSV